MMPQKFKRDMKVNDAGVSGKFSARAKYIRNEIVDGKKVLKSYQPDVYNHEGKIIGKYDDNNEGSIPLSMSKTWRKQNDY